MDAKEKLVVRYRLALTIQKIISVNQTKAEDGLATSLRKLAASSDTEYAIIQKITASKKDPQFSTLAAIVDGLGISFSEFFQIFESVTKDDIDDYKGALKEKSKRTQSLSVKLVKKTEIKKRK